MGEKGNIMEEQEQYAPETEETPEEVSEETGEQAELEAEETEQVEEQVEPTSTEPTAKEKALLKAKQDEVRKRQAAEKELADYKMAQLAPKDEPLVRPKAEDFTDYDDYVIALSKFTYHQEQAQTRKLTQEQIAQREQQKLMDKAKRDGEVAAVKYEDFYDVIKAVVLPQNTLEAMYQSDIGAEIAYHLGNNPAELERLRDFTPAKQIMELGKLEAKLAAKTANPKAKEVKKATEVEASGDGFRKPRTDITKIRDKAIATGDWTEYLDATGNL